MKRPCRILGKHFSMQSLRKMSRMHISLIAVHLLHAWASAVRLMNIYLLVRQGYLERSVMSVGGDYIGKLHMQQTYTLGCAISRAKLRQCGGIPRQKDRFGPGEAHPDGAHKGIDASMQCGSRCLWAISLLPRHLSDSRCGHCFLKGCLQRVSSIEAEVVGLRIASNHVDLHGPGVMQVLRAPVSLSACISIFVTPTAVT